MALIASAAAAAASAATTAATAALGSPRSCSISSLRQRRSLVVRSEQQGSGSATTATTVSISLGGVTEVDKDSFWPIVDQAGDKVVVLDMYTQWCGPCKMMFPKIVELSSRYSDVVFLKLDCNQANKPLAKELGIRVVPTFKILKHRKIVAEIAGAKFDDLVRTIDTVRSD